MFKKLYLLAGSIIAACTSLIGQIADFIELSDAENPLSEVADDMQVHLADLDDDGFEEVIMHTTDMSSMRYFQNDGTGTLSELDPLANPLSAILLEGSLENGDNKRFEFADFDNDGDTDVAVFSQKYYNDGSVLLFENDGAQNYTEIPDALMLPGTLSNGQFTDIDGDGDLDCVTSNFIYDDDSKLWNAYNQVAEFDDVTGTFGDFSDFPNLVGDRINFIDIDEDGDEDSFSGLSGMIQWQEKLMPSMFSAEAISIVPQMQDANSVFFMDVGDLDSDGILEMVVYDPGIAKMRMYRQTCADPPGTACDDGDDCTTNDTLDADCNCIGIFQDADNDGVCDAEDQTNGDCTLGASCDDGDDCTVDDVFDADCNCAGVESGDSDNDGICDALDETNGDCTLGASCDDGDDCTTDDALDTDCNCVGIFQDSDNDGVCDAIDDTNGDCVLGAVCDDGDDCTSAGFLDSDCQCITEFLDEDEDGVCDAEDECPGLDDSELANVGDADMDGDVDCDDLLVSVDEILASQFNIYPNPTNGLLRLETDLRIQEILLYSAMGQVIAEIDTDSQQVDLQSYAQGVYFIEIRTEEGTLRKRIILQK